MTHKPKLIVITGPTGAGKTDLAIELARNIDGEIVSADSRQVFRSIPIGTAAPTPSQLAEVPHHLVQFLDLDQYYSAAKFEEDALRVINDIWSRHRQPIVCGGSMMYIDALLGGIDPLPTILPEVRQHVLSLYQRGGIEEVRQLLRQIDPDYYSQVDLANHRRIIHAIEITMQAGVPYSTLRTGGRAPRPFEAVKFVVDLPREELFERINTRVARMIESGLEKEARDVYHLRHLNSLNTVGYKEMFAMFDGRLDRPTAIARIAKNTRVYAKKQLTWLRRDPSAIHVRSLPELLARLESS